MTVAQILAVSIFVVMFVLMVLDKIEKQYITLVAGSLYLVWQCIAWMRSSRH